MHFHGTALLLLLGSAAPSLSAIINKEFDVKIDVQINTVDDAIPADGQTTIAGDKDVSTADDIGIDTIDAPFQLGVQGLPYHIGAGEQMGPGNVLSLLPPGPTSPLLFLENGILRQEDGGMIARAAKEDTSNGPKPLFVMDESVAHREVLWKVVQKNGERHLVLAKHGGAWIQHVSQGSSSAC